MYLVIFPQPDEYGILPRAAAHHSRAFNRARCFLLLPLRSRLSTQVVAVRNYEPLVLLSSGRSAKARYVTRQIVGENRSTFPDILYSKEFDVSVMPDVDRHRVPRAGLTVKNC